MELVLKPVGVSPKAAAVVETVRRGVPALSASDGCVSPSSTISIAGGAGTTGDGALRCEKGEDYVLMYSWRPMGAKVHGSHVAVGDEFYLAETR